ncbi:hypothetical protein FB451DRAFT_1390949 [Mycena latifolia]|nr:hypothetical protein FB451DRAFT_1390949 [Mycena latifolia]
MATFRTTSISASKRSSKRISLVESIVSLASLDSSSTDGDTPRAIVVTTTVSTTRTTYLYPAPVPPPFATSLGSDDVLPRPKHGAPPVAPAAQGSDKRGIVWTLRRAVGLERTRLDPALCEGW